MNFWKDEVVGTVRRSEAHKDSSKIHREVAILLFTKDGRVLLEERSFKKDHEPGAWRIPAGHILSGEDPENMAKKEVFEELGIKINPVFYGKKFSISEGRESRFFWIYYAILNENIKINFPGNFSSSYCFNLFYIFRTDKRNWFVQ